MLKLDLIDPLDCGWDKQL